MISNDIRSIYYGLTYDDSLKNIRKVYDEYVSMWNICRDLGLYGMTDIYWVFMSSCGEVPSLLRSYYGGSYVDIEYEFMEIISNEIVKVELSGFLQSEGSYIRLSIS